MARDQNIRGFVEGLPGADIQVDRYATPPALSDARVAIVTTAGLRPAGEVKLWAQADGSFVELPASARDLQVSHFSPNFDRAGYVLDPNVVYPADRLDELAQRGTIGSVNHRHFSFMGAQSDLATVTNDTGPAAAQQLRDDGVDVVLLTPI